MPSGLVLKVEVWEAWKSIQFILMEIKYRHAHEQSDRAKKGVREEMSNSGVKMGRIWGSRLIDGDSNSFFNQRW